MLALTNFEKWKCPSFNETALNTVGNETIGNITDNSDPYWQTRLNMITGSIMVASVFEIILGASGILTILLRFIGPLTVAPTIMMMGLGVVETGYQLAGTHWGIAFGTIGLIILLSECIPKLEISLPCTQIDSKEVEEKYQSGTEQRKTDIVFHKMFSVIISVCLMWLLCYILTITSVFPNSEDEYGYHARTDLRDNELKSASWVSFPYPGRFGTPTFNSGPFVAFIAGVVTSVIESIGDYYTCARIAGAPPPPPAAINRGILVEGIDCILSASVGLGFGVTSCSQNIGVISLTKVGSRRVVLVAGLLMMIFGCFNKFSAFVVTVPDPIVGASFIVLFGVLAAVGASNLQYVDLNSSRNMVVFGLSLFMGLTMPPWTAANEQVFANGNENAMQVVLALLGNGMFMACFTALILDNLIPGTLEERGIAVWKMLSDDQLNDDSTYSLKTYDFPFGMAKIRQWKWTQYVPFCPTFVDKTDKLTLKCCKGENDKGKSGDITTDDISRTRYNRVLDSTKF